MFQDFDCGGLWHGLLKDLKHITRVVVRSRVPFFRTSLRPIDPKLPYREFDLMPEFESGAPLLLLKHSDEVCPGAKAVAELLGVSVIQTDTNPFSSPRPPQLFPFPRD